MDTPAVDFDVPVASMFKGFRRVATALLSAISVFILKWFSLGRGKVDDGSGHSSQKRAVGKDGATEWYISEQECKDLQARFEQEDIEPSSRWKELLKKDAPHESRYTALWQPTAGGKTEYKTTTILPGATAEEILDFNLDEACRKRWEKTLVHVHLLEQGSPPAGIKERQQVVRYVRHFPMGCITDREYVVARRAFRAAEGVEAGDLFFVCKDVDHPLAKALAVMTKTVGVVRVRSIASGCRLRTIKDPWGGEEPACEVVLLHTEDIRVSEGVARFAVKMGMLGFVKEMTAAVPAFLKDRRLRAKGHEEDPQAYSFQAPPADVLALQDAPGQHGPAKSSGQEVEQQRQPWWRALIHGDPEGQLQKGVARLGRRAGHRLAAVGSMMSFSAPSAGMWILGEGEEEPEGDEDEGEAGQQAGQPPAAAVSAPAPRTASAGSNSSAASALASQSSSSGSADGSSSRASSAPAALNGGGSTVAAAMTASSSATASLAGYVTGVASALTGTVSRSLSRGSSGGNGSLKKAASGSASGIVPIAESVSSGDISSSSSSASKSSSSGSTAGVKSGGGGGSSAMGILSYFRRTPTPQLASVPSADVAAALTADPPLASSSSVTVGVVAEYCGGSSGRGKEAESPQQQQHPFQRFGRAVLMVAVAAVAGQVLQERRQRSA